MKKTNWIGLLGTLIASGSLTGCDVVDSSQVSSSTDYASYTAIYNVQSNSAQYTAHFSVGGSIGTVLELNGNSQVTVDGNVMSEERDLFNDVTYEAGESGTQVFPQVHEFSFTDQNGNQLRNDFQFPAAAAPASGQSMTGSLQNGFFVNWVAQNAYPQFGSVTATLTRSDGYFISAYGNGGSSGTVDFSKSRIFNPWDQEVSLSYFAVEWIG